MGDDTGRLSAGEWGWAAPGRRHRIMMAGIELASADRSPEQLLRAGRRQIDQWRQYREAADHDFRDLLAALHSMSRPWDQALVHQMSFRLTDSLRFSAESDSPGPAEVPVYISLGTMLALDDFFVRLACHGGFFSAGPDGRWWTGCECFWAGRGEDCVPFTRYFDYQYRINAAKIWNTWLTAFFFGIPLDIPRLGLACFMFQVGVLWLMMHEEGHYCEGHLLYQQARMGAYRSRRRVSEVEGAASPGQDPLLHKVMEWQADRSATRAVIDVVHAPELLPMLPPCCPGDALALRRLILTAIGCVVLVMDKARQMYQQAATYPTPRTRLLGVILAAMAHGLDRGSEYLPRKRLPDLKAEWQQAVALSLADLRVAAHVLQVDSDLPDYKLGVEAMPTLDDTLLREDADFQAAWAAATLVTTAGMGRVDDRRLERYLRHMTKDSELGMLLTSSALANRTGIAPAALPVLTAGFHRWWDELSLLIDRHDNYLYDVLAPYRAAVTKGEGGTR